MCNTTIVRKYGAHSSRNVQPLTPADNGELLAADSDSDVSNEEEELEDDAGIEINENQDPTDMVAGSDENRSVLEDVLPELILIKFAFHF